MQHDYVLLAVGLIRAGLWMFGVVYAILRKRPLALAGLALATVSSTITAFSTAHFGVPIGVVEAITFVSPLIPAFLISSFILHGETNKRWRL